MLIIVQIVFRIGCILINKVHWQNIQELRNFGIFSFREIWINAKLIFVSHYFQFCLRAEAVMAVRFSFVIELVLIDRDPSSVHV